MFVNQTQRVLLLISLFVPIILCQYIIPTPNVTFYENCGFEVSIPADPAISLLSIDATKKGDPIPWHRLILTPTAGRFAFIEASAKFNIGDTLTYRLQVNYHGDVFDLLQSRVVRSE